MSSLAFRFSPLVVVVALAACASKPEPVTISPTFDKAGTPTCPAGLVLARDGATGADICVDPATL